MANEEVDELRDRLEEYVGKPMGPPSVAPDPVNVPMIRHWVDALDDRNPVYLDEEIAANSRFGGIVAPPAMLQVWSMSRPKIEGIAERGGGMIDGDTYMAPGSWTTASRAVGAVLDGVDALRAGDTVRTIIQP